MWIYIKLILTAMLWGGTFIAGKVIGRKDGPVEPSAAAFIRFAVSAVIMIAVCRLTLKRLPRPDFRQLLFFLLLGFCGVFLYNIFFFTALRTIEASRSSIIIATTPVFVAIFSSFLFREKLTIIRLAGILMSITGALTVITKGKPESIFSQSISTADYYIFGCVICWTAYSLLGKRVVAQFSPLVMVSYSVLCGAVMLFIPAAMGGMFGKLGTYAAKDWISLIYFAVFATVIGYIWFFEGISKIGPVRTALFINFIPIFAVIMAYLFLKEEITASLLIGTLLVITGVYLTNKISATVEIPE